MSEKRFKIIYFTIIFTSILFGIYAAIFLYDIRFLYASIAIVLVLNIIKYYLDSCKIKSKKTDLGVLLFLTLLAISPISAILIVTFT